MPKNFTPLIGLRLMSKRLNQHGGYPQQDRMIRDKTWTLDHAVKYSYQGAKIKKVGDTQIALALMNPDKLTQDYDNKMVSVDYKYEFQPGDIFEWCNTESKWIIYLQDLDELAYFRGTARRCRYQVSWLDEANEVQTTYLAVRGPVETRIEYIQKSGDSVDKPNHSINFLMPKNEATLKYFRRYARFYLQGIDEGDKNTCWRVEATDSISLPGVLEINAVEYYANETTDDLENGIANGLIVKPIEDNHETLIIGEGFIQPKIEYTYTYIGKKVSTWSIDSKYPVTTKIDGKTITVKWNKTYHGEFELKYGDYTKTVVVESMF